MKAWVVVFLTLRVSVAYKWKLDDSYDTSATIGYSELYMYGTDDGPWPVEKGESKVRVRVHWLATTSAKHSAKVAKVKIAALESDTAYNLSDPELDLCKRKFPSYVTRRQEKEVKLTWDDNATAFVGRISESFDVKNTGRQVLVMQNCPSVKSYRVKGNVQFKNPYGMLLAMYFGFLPFEGARALGLTCLVIFFLVLLKRHSDKLNGLHYAIFFVLAVAAAEAWTWFVAYVIINKTGHPLCCPFRPVTVAAMSLLSVQQTASRALLLIVALGFGLVRSSLSKKEALAVTLLSVAYLGANVAATAVKVQHHNHLKRDDDDDDSGATTTEDDPDRAELWTDAPALVFELLFLSWIYAALLNVTDLLRSQGQTYKLQMFQLLNYTIVTFVALTTLLTVIQVLAKLQFFQWPWQLYWLQTVSLEALNFAVLAAVALIWRPTERSQLLVMHDQLSTVEQDDDEDDFEDDGGIELT